MGKVAGDAAAGDASGGGDGGGSEELAGSGGGGRRRWRRRLRCVAALVLGAAVLLSAVFWLPPFARRRGEGAADRWRGADVVASFRLQRVLSELNENISKLEYDIFEEIGTRNTTVAILSMEQTAGSNWTNVIFGIWPYPRNSTISPTELSILRSSLVSLVIKQSTLYLTPSLFGNSSSFEILKFPGGITIIPPQNAFVPQKPDALFNFSLNFPIDVVQDKVSELKIQMKYGLLLNSYENLYVTLTNLEGSTTTPPTVVEASILLAVGAGNKQPSLPRLKQLAQTLRNSSSGNLGLNHTVFGRVKQISLSSYLQHAGSASSPSPAPQPYEPHPPKQNHHHHQHHHHHHHSHHHHSHDHHRDLSHQGSNHLTPAPAPLCCTPAFVSCNSKCARKKVPHNAKFHSPRHMDPPLRPIVPVASPNSYETSDPYIDPPVLAHPRIPSSPLSAVVLHAMPPSASMGTSNPRNKFSSISPAPSTSSTSASGLSSCWWIITSLLYLSMRLL